MAGKGRPGFYGDNKNAYLYPFARNDMIASIPEEEQTSGFGGRAIFIALVNILSSGKEETQINRQLIAENQAPLDIYVRNNYQEFKKIYDEAVDTAKIEGKTNAEAKAKPYQLKLTSEADKNIKMLAESYGMKKGELYNFVIWLYFSKGLREAFI